MTIELYDLLRFFARHAAWFLIAAALGALLGMAASLDRGSGARGQALISLSVSFDPSKASSGIQYDGYYVIEAERRLGILMAEMLRGADFQSALPEGMVIRRVERVTPTDYRVTFLSNRSQEDAADVLERAANGQFALLNAQLENPLTAKASVSSFQRPSRLNGREGALAGASAGLVLCGFFLALRVYYRFRREGVVNGFPAARQQPQAGLPREEQS